MGSVEEVDVDPFEDLIFEGDLVVLDAIVEWLRMYEEHKDHRVHIKVLS